MIKTFDFEVKGKIDAGSKEEAEMILDRMTNEENVFGLKIAIN